MKPTKKEILISLNEGTTLWLKIVSIAGAILGASYLISKVSFLGGIIFSFYLLLSIFPAFIAVPFEGSTNTLLVNILSLAIFPLYLLIAVYYFYLFFKKNKTIWWLTTLFVVSSIFYILGIFIGLFIFLVWHP